MRLKKGKLVVLEGTDGSGKGTQQKLLLDYFKKNQIPHAKLDFPQYYKTFFGRWIGRFLKGEFGTVEQIHPYLVMFPYAADRWQAKKDLFLWLNQGKIVLANRYTGSAAYQVAKLPKNERDRFTKWSMEMEYEAFGIPREDIVIFLHVPFKVSQKLIEQKGNRKYMGNNSKKDIHEANERLMREVEKVYLGYCKKFHHWIKIDCCQNGKILSRDKIHRRVLSILKQKKII